jgi:uncharacterized protein involved in response to NO
MLSAPAIGPLAAAALDLSFLLLLVLTIARELITGRNWRNLPILALIALFALGNGLIHLEATGGAETAGTGLRLAIFVLVTLIALVGGRIVPSFTRNWLNKKGAAVLPAPMDRLDRLAVLAVVGAGVAQVIFPGALMTSTLTLLAALLHAARLARWRTVAILSEPLLWIMHLGYGWIAIGLFLMGLSGFTAAIPESAAFHALTVGGFATMILAVMTRASLGHSGRELRAGPGTVAVFALITLAAVARTVTPFLDGAFMNGIWISGAAWTAGFALFSILYWPVFTRLRG